MNVRERCRRLWEDPGPRKDRSPFALLLEVFSLFYRVGVVLRNDFYDRELFRSVRLPCRVISVGNVTAGGTGKTPIVILLARLLKDSGYRPAVLSRGYGGKGKAPVNIVSDGASILMSPLEGGDEPVLIARSVPGIPVLTGSNRCLTGRNAIERMGADVLILDDGFQHRRLFRDINIVLLDSDRPWGNGFLLPRGPLREPPTRALRRADIVIRTGGMHNRTSGEAAGTQVETGDSGAVLLRSSPIFRGIHQPCALISLDGGRKMDLQYLAGERICAFAGIGVPEQFRKTLESLGAEIVEFLAYPDHHRYDSSDLAFIERTAKEARAEMIVTTEKDEIKLAPMEKLAVPTCFLSIEMRVEPQKTFEHLVLERMKDG